MKSRRLFLEILADIGGRWHRRDLSELHDATSLIGVVCHCAVQAVTVQSITARAAVTSCDALLAQRTAYVMRHS